ncbi:GNAT family N-acetyltransferase [Nigerium massiliense]|uniref:GNAT family N-acetyltransferase n=1 Tax=Nigerium massiliense TaxID=1522317 RepID=UPI0006935AEC|nr:GNAT family N-acetyltransferase [Nigerium massiliense]
MSFYFADYSPQTHGEPLPGLVVRPGVDADLAICGSLCAQREGGDPQAWAERLSRACEGRVALFVAEVDGAVVGFGKVAHLTPEGDGGHGAPDGWYLGGVVVAPQLRRRGIGRALTRARCAWVWERDETVYYLVNENNRASLDLHRELGFSEISRDFHVPGVMFSGGAGLLCGADAASAERQNVVELRVRPAR